MGSYEFIHSLDTLKIEFEFSKKNKPKGERLDTHALSGGKSRLT
jgi:hypothetical protein